jgi:hypothetical protein
MSWQTWKIVLFTIILSTLCECKLVFIFTQMGVTNPQILDCRPSSSKRESVNFIKELSKNDKLSSIFCPSSGRQFDENRTIYVDTVLFSKNLSSEGYNVITSKFPRLGIKSTFLIVNEADNRGSMFRRKNIYESFFENFESPFSTLTVVAHPHHAEGLVDPHVHGLKNRNWF